MKRIYLIFAVLLILGNSCKNDFLDKIPKTAVTKEQFFNNASDLETYTNGLYSQYRATYSDLLSDNIALSNNDQNADLRTLLAGTLNPGNVGGWNSWGDLRNINFMLENAGKAKGDPAIINHYIGVARFFRASFYFKMVKRHGDVPWYNKVVGTNDPDLYKAKDPRTLIVDSIMSDLEFAAANILPNRTDNSYITKWGALTFLSRVALHEGSYRKYHTELNLTGSANTYLQRAVSAALEVMNSGNFEITGTNVAAFNALFASNNLSANKEVIYLQKNNKDLGLANNSHTVLDWQWALSASLADEFLMNDGSKFTSKPDYKKTNFVDLFKNRDPRLSATIMPPGFSINANESTYITKPNFGGLLQIKFYPKDPILRGGWDLNYTDLPIFRLGEVVLNFAEAKAELGTLTQADLELSVNKLRTRVGMPPLILQTANASADPYLATQYPNVTGANKGVLLEIRRERRVELACEGFRFDDLYRWKAGALLAKQPAGFYVPALGGIDVTGDGIADIAILENNDETPLAGIPAEIRAKIPKYNINTGTFYLENGTSGRILFNEDKTVRPRSFDETKYYYFPIPMEETVLNPSLKQPTGWE